AHVQYIKSLHNRGFKVEIWSGNGWAWAAAVVKELGLEKYISRIKSKPVIFIDDKHPAGILGLPIFIENNGFSKNKNGQ
ncbi:MAG: hypothetical protein HC892_19360, partial [Saprospiraceae bacterium]|nr:hypothetical protein [Saprospiraceae bacterium]